ncbi:A nuclease of the HNH/ENDO VII superfamily with conserved WHH, partial [Andreprevotia lacus DSM 23236]
IEGKSVVRNNDTCTLNGGNCPGLYVTMPIPGGLVQGGKLTKTADPAKVLTPAQLKAWSEKAWAWAKENAAKGVEGAKSMLHEVEQALDKPVEGVTGFAKDTANVTVGGANLLSMLASAEGASWVQYAESISPTPGGEAIKAQAEQILQNPGSIPLIPEPFPNLTDAEKGGALLSNLSPKAGAKLLVVGMTKAVGKDLEKALVKEGAKALEKSAAKDAEKAALKKAEEDAAKKQAEEAAKKSKPHEPQKEGKPKGEGSPGDGAKVKPKSEVKKGKNRKPRQPRTYEKKVINEDGSVTYTLKGKNGKTFDVTYRDGYPDFSPYKYNGPGKSEVEINMTGNNTTDFKAANQKAGFGDQAYSHPEGYTWHHHQDGKTMQLIREDAHAAAPHTGGASGSKY